MKVLIIGGVAGGASAAARLRRLDEEAEIILLERGDYISFANCGLPYYISGEITQKSALILQTPESFQARFHIDVRAGHEAVSIDTAAKVVSVRELKTGREYGQAYDKLILSPGAEPLCPDLPGIGGPRVFTLRNIPDAYRIDEFIQREKPRTAIVIGGGYIGVEMAESLVRRGLQVSVAEAAPHLIGPLDEDMAVDVHRYLRKKGVRLYLNNGAKAIRPQGKGLEVTLAEGVVQADFLLLAIGVRPESTLARAAGLALNERGAVQVNQQMQTSHQDIYAVGDVVQVTDFVAGTPSYVPLAGPASRQGRIAADNICGIPSVYKGTQGSSVLRLFDMTVAVTGLNECGASRQGIDYDKVYLYSTGHAGYYPGAGSISTKVLFEKSTGRILGAQLIGFEGVDKRCDVIATAIRGGMTAADLAELELCYAPPYSSAKDPVNMAGFMIDNLLTGKVKQFHWHDVDCLPRDGSVTLLDVRTPMEHAGGGIAGTVNIPLDNLRDRIGELDTAKPVYVHCQSGLRSYLACRILTQKGFDCYNLTGGYRLYHAVTGGRG